MPEKGDARGSPEGKPRLGSLVGPAYRGVAGPLVFSGYTAAMLVALNTAGHPADSAENLLQTAQQAGFAGVELALTGDGPVRYEDRLQRFGELRRIAADLGVRIVGLSGNHYRSDRKSVV